MKDALGNESVAEPEPVLGAAEGALAALHAAPPPTPFGTYLQFRAVMRLLEERLEARLEAHSLTITEFCALRLLEAEGHSNLSRLGEWVSIGNSGVTKLVDRLERKGWVLRLRDEFDRRSWNVHLTQQGADILASVVPRHQANVTEFMTKLDPNSLKNLHRELTNLRAALSD